MIMLASLRAHPRRGVSSADAANEKLRARDLFERVVKEIQITDGDDKQRTVRGLGEDVAMWVELARLWESDSLEKTARALKEALRISKEKAGEEGEDPRLLNNLAALRHLEGDPAEARQLYEDAITSAAKGGEELSTSILYNLARCYEDLREVTMAKEAYEKLLTRHPEYIDGKSHLCLTLRSELTSSSSSQDPTSTDATRPQPNQRRPRAPQTSPRVTKWQSKPARLLHLLPFAIPPIQTSQRLRLLHAQGPR
jgi:RNA polymerase-associated protein CTR9